MKGFANDFIKHFAMTLAAVGTVASFAACSVEATSPASPFTPTPAQTAAKAMAAEGRWATDCTLDQGNYQKETMTLKDNTLSVKVDLYNNSVCGGAPMFSATVDGTMLRYGTSFYVTGGHDIEVTMTPAGSATQTVRTVFLIENGVLYTSDKNNTSAVLWPMSVDRTRPYHFIGG